MELKTGKILNKETLETIETVAYNTETLEVQYYDFNEETELLITDLTGYYELYKPRWNGEKWVESATKEEIAKWEEENKPQEPEPSQLDIIEKRQLATEKAIADLIMMGGMNNA